MMRFGFFLILLVFSAPAWAEAKPDFTSFAHIPVQHEGRIKPLDSFARTLLKQISGKENTGGMAADEWLAESLFDPAQALQRPIFRILKPHLLGLPAREKPYYSYAELAPALQKRGKMIAELARQEDKNLSEEQRETLKLQGISFVYAELLRSFSMILPLNIERPSFIKRAEETPVTLDDYRRYKKQVEDRLKQIIHKKGTNPEKYTGEEIALADFSFKMKILEEGGGNNALFRILPGQERKWFSPWMIGEMGEGSPATARYFDMWKGLAYAYLQKDAGAWKNISKNIADEGATLSKGTPLALEVSYNTYHPLTIATLLYFACVIALIFHALRPHPWLYTSIKYALLMGVLFHAAAIIARVVILSRPPVGTLYESILFVALIVAATGYTIAHRRSDATALMMGSVGAAFLLFIAQGFADDNTMPVLVAVLNTNFWLATHVLCITTGYAWCLMTAAFAHLWLWNKAKGRDVTSTARSMKILSITALLFTAVGTILGGIWADQSWGRFWGWDPKENGALLIVLWLIWILHGQLSGHISKIFAAALMAMLSIVVALAWFGVNLLNTGLHSYGFISGIAAGLAAFCVAELALIGALVYIARKAEHKP